MVKLVIPYTEIMVTQVCNLSCQGCSTYSDIAHKGYVSWSEGEKQLKSWLNRVDFSHIGIMGGEPLVNPQISSWIKGIRNLMPDTTIRFPTNGILLPKHLDIIDLLGNIGNVILKITVHVDDLRVQESIKYIMNRFNWEEINEFGINRFVTKNNFKFQINRPTTFFKTFQNDYADATPYDSDPTSAFEVCHQKECPLMIGDRIYKCSTSGLMSRVLDKFNNPNYNKWEKYLDHTKNGSISLASSNEEIKNFILNIKKSHSTCSQCPDSNSIVKLDHLSTVKFVNKK
jgi:organic radical activating enzyme